MKLFVKAPEVVNLGDEIPEQAIFISNHVGAKGPTRHELYLPRQKYVWGTYEMCLNVKGRFDYLKNVYFRVKFGHSKFVSLILAIFALPITSAFYKGIQVIPTYKDIRLMGTMKKSMAYLKDGKSILIFPEDSSSGYHNVLLKYFSGFVVLAKLYKKTMKKDIPIVSMYYAKENNKVAIDKAYYLTDFEGKTDDEIAEWFKTRANEMGEMLRGEK